MICGGRIVMVLVLCFSLLLFMSFAEAYDLTSGSDAAVEAPIEQIDDYGAQFEEPYAYGTTADTSVFTHSSVLKCWDSAVLIGIDGFGYGSTTAACDVIIGFSQLPMGAALKSIQLEACDSSATAGVEFNIYACLKNAAGCTNLASATTGVSATPGCGLFSANTATHTVRNDQYDYFIVLRETDASTSTRWNGVKVFYTLQISPAPATATFSDVPTTHPFFQQIEALAASGITTGFPDGTFRPGDYVTRQAMAAFLSRALGLHWPN